MDVFDEEKLDEDPESSEPKGIVGDVREELLGVFYDADV